MDQLPLTRQHAQELDAGDSLAALRRQFEIPHHGGQPEIYFVGNSLGLMPKLTSRYIQQELDQWRRLGVRGHFEGPFPWLPYHEFLTDSMAALVGAQASEVVVMNGLTVNLHLMMASFYQPSKQRTKILIEQHAFPSDSYAARSRLELSGLDPDDQLVVLQPDNGDLFSADYICATIEQHADELALVLLPGVQYYTGQVLDIKRIAATCREHGITVGMDLAHAVGNVELQLHDWGVDFAVWCNYKYLNSGPGAVAGCFIHQRHVENRKLSRMAGWWGHDKASRFDMKPEFEAIPTAEGWQLSNPPIVSMAAVRAALEVFELAGGMAPLRQKSIKLTGFFADLLQQRLPEKINVITPAIPEQRGCQLSLEVLGGEGKRVHETLEAARLRTDWREPNVIRAAPVPLYNTFEEVWEFVDQLAKSL